MIHVDLWDVDLFPDEKGLTIARIFNSIKDACAPAIARAEKENEERDALRAAESARAQEQRAEVSRAANAKHASEFRDGVMKAWSAAGESDPFGSVRGAFDLGASDSHQWKAMLQLPDSVECELFKGPSSPSPGGPLWTYACEFKRESAWDRFVERFDSYERIVHAVESSLSISFQPDETAASVNQVFFSDPAEPDWKLVVTKVGDGSGVLLWITPRGYASVAPFTPTSSAASGSSIRDEVEQIESGPRAAGDAQLPNFPGQSLPGGMTGKTAMTVQNSTQYNLSIYFEGPVSR